MAEQTGVIEQYAQHLERKASGLVLRFTAFGAFVGAALGGFPLFQSPSSALVPHHFGYATLLLGAAAGGYLGWSFGERRAVEPRFQAQLALRQLQVEQTLLRHVVAARPAPARVGPPATASVPASAPADVPAAVRPPVPAPASARVASTVAPPVAPPVVQVAPAPAAAVEVAPAPAPLPAPASPPVPEPAPPAALAPPPRLVQPPLSSTGA